MGSLPRSIRTISRISRARKRRHSTSPNYFPHDEFAKGLLESLLAPFGKVEAAYTLSSETREIDVYFQPDSIPTNLGLLSQFAATAAVFEAYRNPVDLVKIRTSCLAKL
jgi:hypothetical protein